MKNLILAFVFNVFSTSLFAQVAAKPIKELDKFFTLIPKTDITCDSWGATCFFTAEPKIEKKERPDWMGKEKIYFAIKLTGTKKISRAYSDVTSICTNKGVELRNPVVEFKHIKEGEEYVIIIYKKAKFPKEKSP